MDVRVSVGMEIEFYIPSAYEDDVLGAPMVLIRHGLHRDYHQAYEVSTDPFDLERWQDFANQYLELKDAIEKMGGHLVAEFSDYNEGRWTCGSHIHVRIEPERPELWARAFNWLTFLVTVLAPMQTSCRVATSDENGRVSIFEKCPRWSYAFRFKVQHFATPPIRMTYSLMKWLLKTRKFRSVFPHFETNDFYGIEINRYRKEVATIEIRTNENGWKTAVALADLVRALATVNSPKINIGTMWRRYIVIDCRVIEETGIINYVGNHPIQRYIDPYSTIPKAAKGLLRYLREELGYEPMKPTRELLEVLASGRRPSFDETVALK